MLNCTFIGIKTKAYEQLVSDVRNISQKHTIKTKLRHINEIDEILTTRVRRIPSLNIMPGDIILEKPNYKEIEAAILNNFTKQNLNRHEQNISPDRF